MRRGIRSQLSLVLMLRTKTNLRQEGKELQAPPYDSLPCVQAVVNLLGSLIPTLYCIPPRADLCLLFLALLLAVEWKSMLVFGDIIILKRLLFNLLL